MEHCGKMEYLSPEYVVRCAIWYHLYNLKNVKNTQGGVLILVKLQAKPEPATLLKVTLLHGCKLYKWYQIAQRTTYIEIGVKFSREEKEDIKCVFVDQKHTQIRMLGFLKMMIKMIIHSSSLVIQKAIRY